MMIWVDRKSTRLNSSHSQISYAVFCSKKTAARVGGFFFNDTATTEIYTLSLHDALPIYRRRLPFPMKATGLHCRHDDLGRSEEHTSELQSQSNLVCRLLLEKNSG